MRYQPYTTTTATTGVTRFPYLRNVVRPEMAELPDAEFTEALGTEFGLDAMAAEDFFGELGRRLPSIGTGALSGAGMGAAAGPWGALIGGLGGALAGGLTAPPATPVPAPATGAGQPTAVRRRVRTGTSMRAAPTPAPHPPNGTAPAAPPGGMAASFATLLSDPTVQKALMQLALGQGAKPQVDLPGGHEVPAVAFAELIRETADQVLAEQEALGLAESAEELPEYLAGAERRHSGSSLDPALRAAVLLRLLDEPYRNRITVPVAAVPVAPGAFAQVAPGAAQPQVAGTSGVPPFSGYQPPDLGAQAPTRYTLDAEQAEAEARAGAEAELADAEWDFEQSLDDILGSAEPR
ncbi:hypothetical protein OG426_54860 (plasmid) [Streptomyces canus]|uniref:hypothetical protein n=1 Tax=Streptomyces canus TaxID=58343 RepID=UPI002F917B1F|nr:hypothetical protein OG426_54860 [Streptomyces canus]